MVAELEKKILHTGEDLKIKLRFELPKERQDCHLWVGLFRMDDVYCHGVRRRLKEEEIVLIYPKIPLLNGDYYISVKVWANGQKEPLVYRHKASLFKISFLGQDHGTVYLEHSWNWRLP